MRKVFKNGNSLAVTIPKAYAHQLSIRDGSTIEWQKSEKGIFLTNNRNIKKATEIDPEVAKLIKKISKKYSSVWQDLAKI